MAEIFFIEEVTSDEVNSYEAVSAASKEARRINQARLMREVTEEAEKPTTLSLKRLSEGKVRISYGDKAGAADAGEADGSAKESKGSSRN